MDVNPNVKVFFVYGKGTTFERKEYDLVYDDVRESVIPPWPTTKVIKAMEYIDANYNYDFLIRTNLSTFWDFDGLLKRLDTLPDKLCLTGRMGYIAPPFVVGTGMIVNRYMITEIVKNAAMVNVTYGKYVAEDRILSEFFSNVMKAPILPSTHIHNIETLETDDIDTILKEIQKGKQAGKDHFRIKNMKDRMLIDTAVAKALCKEYYGKSVDE